LDYKLYVIYGLAEKPEEVVKFFLVKYQTRKIEIIKLYIAKPVIFAD
jgi:hypothetical protein